MTRNPGVILRQYTEISDPICLEIKSVLFSITSVLGRVAFGQFGNKLPLSSFIRTDSFSPASCWLAIQRTFHSKSLISIRPNRMQWLSFLLIKFAYKLEKAAKEAREAGCWFCNAKSWDYKL